MHVWVSYKEQCPETWTKHRGYQGPQPPQTRAQQRRGACWEGGSDQLFPGLLSPGSSIPQLVAEPQRTFAFRNFLVWRWTRALSVSRFSTGVRLSFSLCPCRGTT